MDWLSLLSGVSTGARSLGDSMVAHAEKKKREAKEKDAETRQFNLDAAKLLADGYTQGPTTAEKLMAGRPVGGDMLGNIASMAQGAMALQANANDGGRSISLLSPDGSNKKFRYDSELDPTTIARREKFSQDDYARGVNAENAQELARVKAGEEAKLLQAKKDAKAAAYRIAKGKALPGDEEIADTDSLSIYTNRDTDNARGDAAQRASQQHAEVMAAIAGRREDRMGEPKPYKETATDRAGAALIASDSAKWSDEERNQFGKIVGTLVEGGMPEQQARTAGLQAMGKLSGGGVPRPGSKRGGMRQEMALPNATTMTPPKGAAAPVMRRQSESVPLSGSNAQSSGSAADAGSDDAFTAQVSEVRSKRDAFVAKYPHLAAQADTAMRQDLDELRKRRGATARH